VRLVREAGLAELWCFLTFLDTFFEEQAQRRRSGAKE
jgi:hypothetical protein